MLRVRGKLSDAVFSKPVVGRCYNESGKMIGYALVFEDFYLYMDEYIAQLANIWGIDEDINTKRKLSNKKYLVKKENEDKLLSSIENNTLILYSLSLYLNNIVSESIVLNINEWCTLSRSKKVFICYLFSSRQYINNIIKIYKICSDEEKYELFFIMLSIVGYIDYKLTLIEENIDIVKKSSNIEKLAYSISKETIDKDNENSDKNSQVLSNISENITVVERVFGNFHKSAETEFYESIIEVYNIAERYLGRISWKNILTILRDNQKYSAITEKYINNSWYKLNENNLRNWYKYHTNNLLKSNKFKIIYDNEEIIEIIDELNYNK